MAESSSADLPWKCASNHDDSIPNVPFMKTRVSWLLVFAAWVANPTSAGAQAFLSGSTGSYGAIDVPAGTTRVLDVPADGIFHCTTIRVVGTLRFNRNAMNTPVHLLATGDVTLTSALIDVSGARGSASAPGLAGPGGFDGGAPGSIGISAGDGQGPGGGKAGTTVDGDTEAAGAGYGTTTTQGPVAKRGSIYGSPLLLPMIGGSGGGGVEATTGWGGGGGGGGIVIASDTRVVFSGGASIRSNGGQALNSVILNCGSGGGVRIIAPVVSGSGNIDVRGNGGGTGNGDGRIRIDTPDRSQLNVSFFPQEVASVGGLMVVFLDPMPRLDIVEVAGRAIPADAPAQVLLPTGGSATQPVRIRARDFGGVVPIRIVLTPDNGPSSSVNAEIDNGSANPAETTVNVTFPVNVLTHVHVFSR